MSKDFVKVALSSIPELSVGKTRNTIKLYTGSPKKQLMIDTPVVRLPFGASIDSFKTFTSHNVYYLQASVDDAFVAEWDKFTDKMVEVIDKNRETFDTELSLDQIRSGFKNCLKSNDRGHLLKVNLPRDRLGDFNFHVFDQSKTKLNIDDSNIATIIGKGTFCKALLKVSKMWSFKDKEMFGLTLDLFQLKLSDKPEPEAEEDSDHGIETSPVCQGNVEYEFLE
jgi:hypothetical protein